MRRVRWAFVLPGLMIISSCADGLTEPPPPASEFPFSAPEFPLSSVTTRGDEEDCDPWSDWSWCQCESANDPDCVDDGGPGDGGGRRGLQWGR